MVFLFVRVCTVYKRTLYYLISLMNYLTNAFYFTGAVNVFTTALLPANYPEQVGKFHVINAPWVFSAIWSFAKRILDSG